MLKDIKRYTNHYAVLGAWLALGLFGFVFLAYTNILKFLVVIIFAIGYVVWGVMHHHLVGDLSDDVVLEYLLIAAMTVVILGSMQLV